MRSSPIKLQPECFSSMCFQKLVTCSLSLKKQDDGDRIKLAKPAKSFSKDNSNGPTASTFRGRKMVKIEKKKLSKIKKKSWKCKRGMKI